LNFGGQAVTFRTGIRIAVVALGCAVLAWTYGWYDAYASADKACLRARVGEPAERAKAQLREIAAASGVEVRELGERTSAVFRWMFMDVAACTFVARDGKIAEMRVGKRALEAVK